MIAPVPEPDVGDTEANHMVTVRLLSTPLHSDSPACETEPMPDIQDRIKELRRVRAGDLAVNPQNWRVHGDAQRTALQGVLERVGWSDALIAREDDNGGLHLIDGHLRASLDDDQVVPVLVLDVDEDEAGVLLATLDPLAAMAESDEAMYADLLASIADEEGLLADVFTSMESALGTPGSGAEEPGDRYTRRIQGPVYEPTGEKPETDALYDSSKSETMKAEILAADVPDDVRTFLLSAAERHTVFNFAEIAEFYAHADNPVQELMERSALVIIDFDKAIENGYVQVTTTMGALADEDEVEFRANEG